jgi:hypothetical protein
MESGRVLLTGTAEDVLNNTEMADLFFGGTAAHNGRGAVVVERSGEKT